MRYRTAAVLLLIWSSLGGGMVLAADDPHRFRYSAKFVCSLLGTFEDLVLAEGVYRTAVNVHNPTDRKVDLAEKVSLAVPQGQPSPRFRVTPFREFTLGPDEALEIDCGTIAGFFCPIDDICIDFAFIKGFVVIDSPVELDVVAVYTARPSDGQVATMDVEQIQARRK